MTSYGIGDLNFIGEHTIVGDPGGKFFTNVKGIDQAAEDSLAWIKSSRKNRLDVVRRTRARIIVCDGSLELTPAETAEKCFIVVKNPRLVFLRIVQKLFTPEHAMAVHPTAVIHPDAVVHPNVSIGPFTYIGKAEIGEGSILYGHIHIYDNVVIGKNTIIHAGAVIGSDGFGYERNEAGEFEKFPHIGGVLIEDAVEIGANACIDRGVLGNTHIKTGAKIDNLVHIAHNVTIGRHTVVIANAMIAGSTVVGDHCWVSPSASLLNGIRIGDRAVIGMGAAVIHHVPEQETWSGLPARPLDEVGKILYTLKKIYDVRRKTGK